MFERNACDQRNALANRHRSGVHWLVLSVFAIRSALFVKALQATGVPGKVTMDKSGANRAVMDEITNQGGMPIIKCPRQIPEQTRPAGPPICHFYAVAGQIHPL